MKKIILALFFVFSLFHFIQMAFALTTEPTMVKDIQVGSADTRPAPLSHIGQIHFFGADDGVHGQELWKSDGTEVGTVMVKDINPGPSSTSISDGVVFNDIYYFVADDGTHDTELWRTDGTEAGTQMVIDINTSGSSIYNPDYFFSATDHFFFLADDGINGAQLWKSDGTEIGTQMVKSICSSGSDCIDSQYATILNNTLYFSADDGINGKELWKSDGTEAGTVMVKDINDGEGSEPSNLVLLNDIILFIANDGIHGRELWKSDGTEAGTVMVKDIAIGGEVPDSIYATALISMGSSYYFSLFDGIHGGELWKSDGTEAGTVMVKDINEGSGNSSISSYAVMGDQLFFGANDGIHGRELWKSDGTEAGTVMVKDIALGLNSSFIESMAVIDDLLIFSANDGVHGQELWQSDGSSSGTVLNKDINPSGDGHPHHFYLTDTSLFFNANDGTHGYELWAMTIEEEIAPSPTPTSSPTPSPTPIVALTPTPISTAQSSDNGSSSSAGSPSVCTSLKPSNTPDLFQINVNQNQAILYFAPVNGINTHYYIAFSEKSDTWQHGVELAQSQSSGVVSFTINHLKPNTNYYFRVRGQNDCMPGDFSHEMKVKTRSVGLNSWFSYYKYSIKPAVDLSSTKQSLSNLVGLSNDHRQASDNTNQEMEVSPKASPSLIPSLSKAQTGSESSVKEENTQPESSKKRCFLWWCF